MKIEEIKGIEIFKKDFWNIATIKLIPLFKEYTNHYIEWLAITALETGWLKADSARNFVVNNNNIFGITTKDGKAWQFKNINECCKFMSRMMNNERYKKCLRFYGTDFLYCLHKSGYNETYNWLVNVTGCYNIIKQKLNLLWVTSQKKGG